MTLAQGGTLPSVLQSPVETPTWPSSSPLNKREKRRRSEEWGQGERKQRKEIKKDQESTDSTAWRTGVKKGIEETKRRAEGRRWLSLCCVELLALCQQSIRYYWPRKQKGKKHQQVVTAYWAAKCHVTGTLPVVLCTLPSLPPDTH